MSVLGSATHVTMYQFDPATVKWARYDCEGPLFVVKRNADPRFRLVIVNRLSRNNFAHAITATFHFELVEPYLIFKSQPNGAGSPPTIHGIWFPADEERKKIFDLMTRCVKAENMADETPPQPQHQTQPRKENVAMAEQQQAQREYKPFERAEQATMARQTISTPPPPPRQQQQQQAAPLVPPTDDAEEAASAENMEYLTPGDILGEANVPKLQTAGQREGDNFVDKASFKRMLLAALEDDASLNVLHTKFAGAGLV